MTRHPATMSATTADEQPHASAAGFPIRLRAVDPERADEPKGGQNEPGPPTHHREGGENAVIGAGRGKVKWKVRAQIQSNVTGPRSLGGFLSGEFDTLPLAEQFKHCVPHRASVKEVLDAGFITNESKALVDQQSCDRTRRHTVLRFAEPPGSRPEKPPHHGTRGISNEAELQAIVAGRSGVPKNRASVGRTLWKVKYTVVPWRSVYSCVPERHFTSVKSCDGSDSKDAILAAGASSRMGQPKASLPLTDRADTFLTRLVRTLLAARIPEVIVVSGSDDAEIRPLLPRAIRACASSTMLIGRRVS